MRLSKSRTYSDGRGSTSFSQGRTPSNQAESSSTSHLTHQGSETSPMTSESATTAVQQPNNHGAKPSSIQVPIQISWSSDISQLRWPELAKANEYVNSQMWKQSGMPQEVTQLPENIIVAEKLNQILTWSTWRSTDFPRRTPSVQEPEGQRQLSRSGSNVRGANNSTSTSDLRRSESIRHAIQNPTPQSDRLLSRLKVLRKAMRDPMGLLKDWEKPNLPSQAEATSEPEPEPEPEPQVGECISCFDEYSKGDLVHPPCNHDYCKNCLREVIINAMKTESAFPPKCCLTEIPLQTILLCLDSKQREEYKEKAAEYSIGAGHRWYCPNTACAKWIRPEKLHRNRRAAQTCPHCKTKICSHCRSIAHDQNQDCPQDFGLEATLEIAESEGWRRCYSCRTMVELTTGCRHITCKCGAEFCYVCNARWRTCSCTEEDKNRRLEELRTKREQTEQQRQEEDAAAAAEAEEIAQAIAQVEEMERQEAIERAEEEQRRQEEEEEILATLESLRVEEERQKQVAMEEAEREYEQVLLVSCREECDSVKETLEQIVRYQQSTLASKHQANEQTSIKRCSERDAEIAAYSDRTSRDLKRNIKNRKARMEARESKRMMDLINQLQDEEDAMFMQIQMHLRDKPNREAREKRIRDAFEQEQSEKRVKSQAEQNEVRKRFQMLLEYEMEGVNRALGNMLQKAETAQKLGMMQLGAQVGAERQWFELIATRRMRMVEENERIMFQQLEANQEPVGLTVEKARDIEPRIPAFDDEGPGPSGKKQPGHNQSLQVPATGTNVQAPPEIVESPDMYGADPNRSTEHLRNHAKPAQQAVELPASFVTSTNPNMPVEPPLTPPDSATPASSASSIFNHPPGAYPLSPRDSREMSPPRTDNTTPRNQPRFYTQHASSKNEDPHSVSTPTPGVMQIPMPNYAPPAAPAPGAAQIPMPNYAPPMVPMEMPMSSHNVSDAPASLEMPIPQHSPPPPPVFRQPSPQMPTVSKEPQPFSSYGIIPSSRRGARNPSPGPTYMWAGTFMLPVPQPVATPIRSPFDPSAKRPSVTVTDAGTPASTATAGQGRRKSSIFGLGKSKKDFSDEQIRQMMKGTLGDAI